MSRSTRCGPGWESRSTAEEHTSLFEHLGVERPDAVDHVVYDRSDLYPDAVPCLAALRGAGYRVGIAGNQSAALKAWAQAEDLPVGVIGSSAGWGVRKPERAFFERLAVEAGCPANEVAYVGDRVDNDVVPAAAAAGPVAVHVRRGPRAGCRTEPAAPRSGSTRELPEALARL